MYKNFEMMLLEKVLIQLTLGGTFHINNGPHVVAGALGKYHGISMTFLSMTGTKNMSPKIKSSWRCLRDIYR